METAAQELRECEQRLAGAQLQAQQELWRRKAAADALRAKNERIQADLERSRQTALARVSQSPSCAEPGRSSSLLT